MTDSTSSALRDYLAVRGEERARAVGLTCEAMNPREAALVREAAVMGYVQGVQACQAWASAGHPFLTEGAPPIPPDSVVLATTVDACLAFRDLYPVMARMLRVGQRRRAAIS
jgi:hypothetical protein